MSEAHTAHGRAPRRWAPLAVCAAMFVLALVLRVAWFGVADRSPDEQLYAGFGKGITREGPAWFPHTVAAYVGEIEGEYPWVHRAGFLSLVAVAQVLTGRHDPVAGEVLSTVFSLATVVLAGILAWATIGPLSASLAMLFLAVSPLDLAISRRAWQDSVIAFLALAMVALAFRALAAARPGRWRAAFFVLSVFTLLVKESAVIPFGLAVLALTWNAWHRERTARAALVPVGLGALTGLVALGAVVALCGGPANALQLLKLTPEAWAPDAYLREYQTGGVGYYVTGLRILQPLPWLLGIGAALLAVLRAPQLIHDQQLPSQSRQLRLLGAYALVFLAVSCVYSSKNMRFLSPVYAPIAILAAAMVSATVDWLHPRLPTAAWRAAVSVIALLLAASAVADAWRFEHYFNEFQIQDLATPWFTKADAGKL